MQFLAFVVLLSTDTDAANWDCVSVIVKTGGDLRQEQLAVQLIQEFERIWKEESCQCWVRLYVYVIDISCWQD
jgi:phosphatidylinositol kinase/protein kinase (PI-3  family)